MVNPSDRHGQNPEKPFIGIHCPSERLEKIATHRPPACGTEVGGARGTACTAQCTCWVLRSLTTSTWACGTARCTDWCSHCGNSRRETKYFSILWQDLVELCLATAMAAMVQNVSFHLCCICCILPHKECWIWRVQATVSWASSWWRVLGSGLGSNHHWQRPSLPPSCRPRQGQTTCSSGDQWRIFHSAKLWHLRSCHTFGEKWWEMYIAKGSHS
jgi:hypothetical protein